MQNQILTYESISGPRKIQAPGGFRFSDDTTTLWVWALQFHRSWKEHAKDRQIAKRDLMVMEERYRTNCHMLSLLVGMSKAYWESAVPLYNDLGKDLYVD